MDVQLKDRSEGPYYLQIRTQIEAHIAERRIAPGDSLPSPASVASKLSIDRGEVQRAYFELEQGGLVTRRTAKDFLGKERTTYTVK